MHDARAPDASPATHDTHGEQAGAIKLCRNRRPVRRRARGSTATGRPPSRYCWGYWFGCCGYWFACGGYWFGCRGCTRGWFFERDEKQPIS